MRAITTWGGPTAASPWGGVAASLLLQHEADGHGGEVQHLLQGAAGRGGCHAPLLFPVGGEELATC